MLSLFAGIGGLELGLERAGMTTVGQVELDEYCRSVLEKHWPEVPRHDDVRTAGQWWGRTVRPAVHVVAGGPPCQPFSDAGLGAGVGDERWGWPWMRDVVAAVRPRYVVIENVVGLLRHTEAVSVILGDLAELGFDVRWDVVSACRFGAPQARDRVFFLAYPEGNDVPGEGPLPISPRRVRPQFRRGRGDSGAGTGGWVPEPALDRVAHGVPVGLVQDALHALGNAVVPRVAEHIGRLIVAADRSAVAA